MINRKRLASYLYEWKPGHIRPKRYHAVAFHSPWRKYEALMVLYPFHYLVMFTYWLNMKWCLHCGKPSWIDKMIIEAIKERKNP